MVTSLITGVSGQDGTYLAEALLDTGPVVHGTFRPGAAIPKALADLDLTGKLELHPLDVTDKASGQGILESLQPDEIYNLAAVSSVSQSWVDPSRTVATNTLAVCDLLEAVWRLQSAGKNIRLVQASSAEIFGDTLEARSETTPLAPSSPYGVSKSAAHQLVGVYRSRGVHASNAILFNHESLRRPTKFVTRKITSAVAEIAVGQGKPLTLGTLDVKRDWGWAPDYVKGLILAVRHETPGDYVFATGITHSVAELVESAFASAGIENWRDWVDDRREPRSDDRPRGHRRRLLQSAAGSGAGADRRIRRNGLPDGRARHPTGA